MEVVFFTEGSHEMGMGHITRCQSVGQAFEEKGISPVFYIRGDFNFSDYKFPFEFKAIDWILNIQSILPDIKESPLTIIDSYHAGPEIYQSIREKSRLSVYFDDNNRINYPGGILINGASQNPEKSKPNSDKKYLPGTKYQPVRKEFWELPDKKIKPGINDILIMFGGTDLRNLTPRIVRYLNQTDQNFQKHVVVGPGTKIDLKKADKQENTSYYFSPSAIQLKELMLECDVALSGGGQSVFELARTGIPTLAIEIIDNQTEIISYLEKENFLINLGKWDSVDKNVLKKGLRQLVSQEKRKSMSGAGRRLMDGQGPRRIVDFILKCIKQPM